MADFKKTEIIKYPRFGHKITEDSLYWKNFDVPVTIKDYGSIDYIDFSPENPHCYAVSCSSRVQIYNPASNEVCRSLSRFKEAAYGGSYRHDGKLLVAGDGSGNVQIYDPKRKSLLKILKGHTAATHRCKFMRDGTRVTTFSDDKSVCVWDMPTETKILTLNEHKDYIRAGAVSKASLDIFISGSYDHTVKMYDARTSKCILSVQHDDPVESVLMFSSGNVFLSAGGTKIKVWDAVAGRLLTQLNNHHKTVTCMHFTSGNKFIMSGSLDRHVKVFDIMKYQVVHTFDFLFPILSLAVSPEDKMFAVGMTNGYISKLHQKKVKSENETSLKKQKQMLRQYRFIDMPFSPKEEDIIITQKEREKLPSYDNYLRTFQHSKALDTCLRIKKPEVVVSVIQEIIRRGGIKAAIAGRDNNSLKYLMNFLIKYIGDPRFSNVLVEVALVLIDIYSITLHGQSELISQFDKLKSELDKEAKFMEEMMEVLGAVNSIINSSNQYR